MKPKRRNLYQIILRPLILLFLLFTVFVWITTRLVSRRALESFIYHDIRERHQDMFNGISLVLDEVNLLYSRVILHEDFAQLMNGEQTTDSVFTFRTILHEVGLNQELIADVMLQFGEHTYRLVDHQIPQPDPLLFHDVLNSDRLIHHGGVVKDRDGIPYLIIAKRVRNISFGTLDGVLYFFVREDKLSELYNNIPSEMGYSFLLAEGHLVLSHTQGEYIGSQLFDVDLCQEGNFPAYIERTIDGKRSIIIVSENKTFNQQYQFDWKMVSVLSYEAIAQEIIQLNTIHMILALVMVLLSALLSYTISKRVVRPVKDIISWLRTFPKTGEVPAPQSYNELWELEKTYLEMMNRIAELMEKNQQEMEKQRKLELYALQMQINPHFLYNTLDAIAWMAKIKKEKDIERLVMALAKFFRISLHKGDKFIKVKEEVELVKNFIEIELIRFPNKFMIEYHVDEAVEDCETLKLILQPIVENAIKHGVSMIDHMGKIIINVYPDGDAIVYEVIDNGKGFNIDEALSRQNDRETLSGYGIRNVDERIKLEYGPTFGVEVTSIPNQGTKVTLRIALRP